LINNNYKKKKKKLIFVLYTLIILLFLSSLFILGIGIAKINFFKIIKILLSNLPFLNKLIILKNIKYTDIIIIKDIRLPRILLGILIGAGLSISGASMQGILKNPLIDPYIIGVSSGATFGATIAIVLGISSTFLGFGGISLFSFLGGLSISFLIYYLISFQKKISNTTIILVGISINLFLSSIVSLLMVLNRNNIENIILWIMGSISSANYIKLIFVAPIIIIGYLGLYFNSSNINAISVNEDIAISVGINIKKQIYIILFFSSIITSICVATSGIIGFVGLIIPHIVRIIFGHDNRIVIPFSGVIGAIFIIYCDLLARTILTPSEIPIGIITSIIGAPFFIFLIYKNKKEVF